MRYFIFKTTLEKDLDNQPDLKYTYIKTFTNLQLAKDWVGVKTRQEPGIELLILDEEEAEGMDTGD
jgi:hypothetical protein